MRNFLRAAASCFLIGMAVFVGAQADWKTIRDQFDKAKTREEAVQQIEDKYQQIEEKENSEDLAELIDDFKSATTKAAKDSTYESLRSLLHANSLSENYSTDKDADAKARAIKAKNPLYRAERESSGATWLQKLLERLKHLFEGNRNRSPDMPNIPQWVPTFITWVFYIFCGAIILGLIYVLCKIPWGNLSAAQRAKKARGGLLEEGEELLSEDEYLLQADRLIAEGKFREACRALYLASLLRLDANRVARFEPTQTNWEHLRRIETSKSRPEGLEFRPATKAYDYAWYGYTATSVDDVAIFRETYLTIKQLTGAQR